MRRTLEEVERTREGGEGDSGLDGEMTVLYESIDALSQQLVSALEENERFHSR